MTTLTDVQRIIADEGSAHFNLFDDHELSEREIGIRQAADGANPQWVPGGQVPGGYPEAVIDADSLDSEHYEIITFGASKDGK